MAVGVDINTSDIKKWVAELKKISSSAADGVDYEKVLDMWSREVAREIAKKHGRRYSYVTPPASDRVNLRRRSGRILAAIKAGRYLQKYSQNDYAVVFDVDTMLQYAPHLEPHLDDTYKGTKYSDFYRAADGDYIYIPLKAALDSQGELAVAAPRGKQTLIKGKKPRIPRNSRSQDLNEGAAEPWHDFKLGYMWTIHEDSDYWNIQINEEDASKFRPHSIILSDHGIPYFVAAKTIEIPRRLKLFKDIKYFYDKKGGYGSLHGPGSKLDKEVERVLRRLSR